MKNLIEGDLIFRHLFPEVVTLDGHYIFCDCELLKSVNSEGHNICLQSVSNFFLCVIQFWPWRIFFTFLSSTEDIFDDEEL